MSDKVTVKKILKMKSEGKKIVMITAYDTPFARLVDQAGVDIILVGDSMSMVMLGMENTLGISLREMLVHTRAVAKAKPRALIVGDMPFMSYELGEKVAMRSAGLFAKYGAEAVKLEGGEEMVDIIKSIVKLGVPVMGHVGMTPQRFLKLGGYRLVGKKEFEAEQVIRDALAVREAGVFSVVLELVHPDVAKKITEKLDIPTICIGSGPHCDGQVLVLHDVLGLTPNPPPFAKKYVDLPSIVVDAIKRFADEVRQGVFPSQ
jgi:3-methyl-2-oxobutanoate hydroxymethyltransferase